ncbi:hypothetical protein KDX23_22860 [Burkholderia vietnamiensis]|uniref:hypothetical protein n=1 Tax=Burkholderia vietnamiensis TaxID=60552 RepID=UPI001B9B7E4D|nr:hypothetical protein [Burkholderia vietnamiensis]MBR8085580.1 hypothetical protein [Burkholderia vietnamiensis]
MLAPHSIRLFFDQNDAFRCDAEDSAQVDAYIRAMRVVQQRTGATPRSALSNCAPVHIESLSGPLSVIRVSGIPHHQNPAHNPVALSPAEQALFMKRGDHFILKTGHEGIENAAYIALDYSISPRLITSERPIVLRNPIDAMIADLNATRLLELVQHRELTPAEQFMASQTMPTLWKRYGGPPVAAILNPTVQDAAECYEFAQHFTDPYQRIRTISQLNSEWERVFLGPQSSTHAVAAIGDAEVALRNLPPELTAESAPPPVENRPRMRM